jgi:ribonuclease P protein subunit RPR2
MKRRTSKQERKQIAKKHINELIDFSLNKKYPLLYRKKALNLAKRISLKFKVNSKFIDRYLLCKKCGEILIPGKNISIRLNKKRIVYKCFNCGHINRFQYK